MEDKELSSTSVLMVSSHPDTKTQVRQALTRLGIKDITIAPSHGLGIGRIQTREYPLVLFDAAASGPMPPHEFVEKALDLHKNSMLIALSFEPQIDDVFGLLKVGARGFVVLPLTPEQLETEIKRAKEGPPFNEMLLQAHDRNAALSAVVINNLYKLTVTMRQAKDLPRVTHQSEKKHREFQESVKLAKIFCLGSQEDLQQQFIEDCIKWAKMPSSRLGRARKKLRESRKGFPEKQLQEEK